MSQQKHFYTPTQRTVTDNVPFTKEQFIELITTQKPKEIFNSEYSGKTPLHIITEHGDGYVMYYCTGAADKTPHKMTLTEFYDYCRLSGIANFYIKTSDEATA